MALTTGERSLHKAAIGVEGTHGTAVPPTTYLNMESSAIVDLDRAYAAPQEDYGQISDTQPNRGTYGVKLARMPVRGVVRYEDIMRIFLAGLCGGITPTLVATGVYLWVFNADNTGDTLNSYTVEEGDNLQAFRMTYALVDRIRLSFNALAAPGNSPWTIEADFIGQDKIAASFTGTPSAIASAETAMGHLSTASFGSVSTAFASLSNLVGLLAFDITINVGVIPRVYGKVTGDTFDVHGRGVRPVTFTGTFLEMAGTETAIYDTFHVAGAAPTEQRMRVATGGTALDGSHNKQMYIDGRIRYTAAPVQEQNGASVFAASGVYVADSTLASNIGISVQNGIAT
jgi:hypothetical protein